MTEQQLQYFHLGTQAFGFQINEKGIYVLDKLHQLVTKKGGSVDMKDIIKLQTEAEEKFKPKQDEEATSNKSR